MQFIHQTFLLEIPLTLFPIKGRSPPTRAVKPRYVLGTTLNCLTGYDWCYCMAYQEVKEDD